MAKYLLRCTVEHTGRYTNQYLTAKFNLKVEFDENKQKRGESMIELSSYSEVFDTPCSRLILYIKSYEIEWTEDNKYRDSSIEFCSGTDQGINYLEISTIDDTELKIGFPEPILED